MDISLYCGLHKPLSFNIIKFICSFRKYFFYVFNPWNIEIYNILQIVSVIEECLFTTFGNFVNWIRNFICNLMSKDVGDIYREGYYRLHQTIRMSFRTKFNNGGKYLFIEHSSLCILYDHICSYVVLTISITNISAQLSKVMIPCADSLLWLIDLRIIFQTGPLPILPRLFNTIHPHQNRCLKSSLPIPIPNWVFLSDLPIANAPNAFKRPWTKCLKRKIRKLLKWTLGINCGTLNLSLKRSLEGISGNVLWNLTNSCKKLLKETV